MKEKLNNIINKIKNMNNRTIAISLIGVAIVILVIILCVCIHSSKTLTCTLNNDLIKGFKNDEKVVFNFKSGKISNIRYDRTIKLNDYYKSYDSYIEAIDNVIRSGYEYAKNKDIETTKDTITLGFETKEKGIILNNLNIVYNNDNDDTSLRYDILSDVDNDQNSFKINDKYSKKELKQKINKLGYTCK